ncbi:glutamate synthase [bacterium]|nr:glutamate synthase [bacterium]
MFRELDEADAVFDLPSSKFFRGAEGADLSVRFHGRAAATPFGPAAGPHSQMAQNLVLAWLGGARIVELKTVQVLDELVIPRPCIDMRTIGANVEWSQELKLEESRREYVKGAMLVEMLRSRLGLPPGLDATVWDMSVGYDLDGIRSDGVQAFLRGMMDATPLVEELRGEIPAEYADCRALAFPTHLSGTLTLSTFHGCPPDEIERILAYLMDELRLDLVVKLNPLLAGPKETRAIVHDELGYDGLRIPDSAFEKDTTWDQAVAFVGRLREKAQACGTSFGIKLSNTLVVKNTGGFLSTDTPEAYISGAPLHVLAVNLVHRFRGEFGAELPISFSAGIDKQNFSEAAALGLVPVTVCTDLLRPGGYARAPGYLKAMAEKMTAAGARNVDEWIVRAFGHAEEALDEATDAGSPERAAGRAALADGGDLRAAVGDAAFTRWRSAALLRNSAIYANAVRADERYRQHRNAKPPKKVGSTLELLDCLTCDKCIPVCPNDANFTLPLPMDPIPAVFLSGRDGAWTVREAEPVPVTRKHQIANFVDFCNECGNCDVFCPEDGGPYVLKPRFHGSLAAFREDVPHDALFVAREGDAVTVHARLRGAEHRLERRDGSPRIRWAGPDFDLELDLADPAGSAAGQAAGDVDLGWAHLVDRIAAALLADPGRTWPGALTL